MRMSCDCGSADDVEVNMELRADTDEMAVGRLLALRSDGDDDTAGSCGGTSSTVDVLVNGDAPSAVASVSAAGVPRLRVAGSSCTT